MTRSECLNILDLPTGASRDEIVKAYRHLALVWHPDRFPNNAELQRKAHAKLAQINEAYHALIEGRATPDASEGSPGSGRTEAPPNPPPDSTPTYRDGEVRYLGGDPRLKTPSSLGGLVGREGVAAVVEISPEGLALVTFNSEGADEAMIYAKTSLLAVEEGLNRWVHRGGSVIWPTDKPESLSPVLARLNFLDPEGILTHLIVVTLTFRNAYYCQLFLKRLQSLIRFEKWVLPPPPPPKPKPKPKPPQAAPSGAMSPTNEGEFERAVVMFIGLIFLLVLFVIVLSSPPQPTAVQPTSTSRSTSLYTSRSTGMTLVLIPAGEFTMGSPASEAERRGDEGPQHTVRITQPFYMGVYEVTQSEYESVMGTNPSAFSKTGSQSSEAGGMNTSKFPVEKVSWNDAVAFCQKLSVKDGVTYRLPTEAEWEYAARAGTTTPFHFGSELNGKQANVDGIFPYGTTTKGPQLGLTTPVGSYAQNAFGLFDMHGNVWEWCEDDDAAYASRSGTTTDPKGVTSGSGHRVLRGGSWFSPSWFGRSAARYRSTPDDRTYNYGFRVVISSSAVRTP